MNHWAVHFGPLSSFYQRLSARQQLNAGDHYLNYKKSHGAPHNHWPQSFDELEHNEYLVSKQISADEVRFGGAKLTANTSA